MPQSKHLSTPVTPLVGRERELEPIDALIGSLPRGMRALVLEGEAGIGKTRVWEEALRRAQDRECLVLSCRPAESEAQLAFTALADLLSETLDETLPELPEPQRHALEVALLLSESGDRPADHRAVAMGFLSALRTLAKRLPLVVAIDDVQWLDSSSAAVLEFALRRLQDERVGVLLTLRSAEEGDAPLGLERALGVDRLTRLRLGPLSLGALHRLLREALGTTFSRPVLQRVREASGGNPFFALELGRALERRGGRLGEGGELPMPPRLDHLLYERVAALPAEVRELLDLAALLAEPTVALLERASGRGVERRLARARRAGIVTLERARIRFDHPLLASACLAHLEDDRRRALHRRLADVVAEPEEQARHLALAAQEVDSALAGLVEEAATASLARGARLAAAELLEMARRLTPAHELSSWTRRSTKLADVLYHHGGARSALRVAEEVIKRAEPGPDRALALALSALNFPTRSSRFEQALAEAGRDPALRARIAFMAAATLGLSADFRVRVARSEDALQSARHAGEPALLVQTLTSAAFGLMLTGPEKPERDRARAYLLEAARIEEGLPPEHLPAFVFWTPNTALAYDATHADDLDEARRLYAEQVARATQHGDETSLIGVLGFWSDLEWRAGDFPRALELAAEACEVAERSGDPDGESESLAHLALVQATIGPLEEARTTRARAISSAGKVGIGVFAALARSVAGVIESCVGDHAKVLREIGTLPEELEGFGSGDPASRLWVAAGEEIEARVALGDLEGARSRIDQLEERSRRLERRRPLAVALRGRGLLLAAGGDMSGALEALRVSLAHVEGLQAPFERARTLLALGTVQRRAKQRRAARESLEAALAILEELGAAPWADKVRAELRRIGGRAPAHGELTPTERRVAALVAEGRSNNEVAAALFVAPRTVEWNLTKIYSKLGVRSRAELAHRLATEDEPAENP